jgi:cell wall-associated NlpC family hydrolase
MIRDAIGRIRRSVPSLAAIILSTTVAVGVIAMPAQATGGSADEQRRVNEIINELDRLGMQIDALAEDYALAVNTQEDLAVEIASTEARIAEKEKELVAMQGDLQAAALKSFVRGGFSSTLSNILGSTSSIGDSVRKKYLTSAALNTGAGNTDALQGIIDDLAKERANLEKQRKKASSAADYAVARLSAAESMASTYESMQAAAERELGSALRSERQRRESAALEAAQAEAAKFKGSKYANVAPPSSKAGVAIKAAIGQLGVRYVFGAKSPGNAFDCSGLTSYAWGVAGVGIPRTSRTQYAGLTRIPTAAIQPGDLVFSGYPIHHVGMYVGNGQMVHAPRTGDVVKISALSWSRVVGVARPR